MEITQASFEDIDGILALQPQIYRVKELPKNARDVLYKLIESPETDVIVAREDGKILGSAFLFYLPNPAHGRPYALLEGMVVDEKSRSRGVGTRLTEKAIELARSHNCYKIIFTSGFDRENTHKFYEKLGFKKWGFEFRMDL